jgi:type IV secretory pathway VirB10-like protein
MSSAPWASTNDEAKRGGKPRKKNSGMAVVLGSAAVLLLALVGVGLSLFTGGAKDANDSDIVSAASELSRAATDEKPEAPDPSAATEPTTEPGAGTAQAATAMDTASASVTVVPEAPSDAPSASSTNEPTKREPAKKKSIRRVRPEKPKSAKDRLGF